MNDITNQIGANHIFNPINRAKPYGKGYFKNDVIRIDFINTVAKSKQDRLFIFYQLCHHSAAQLKGYISELELL